MDEAYIEPRPEHPSSVLVDLQSLDVDVCQGQRDGSQDSDEADEHLGR